MTEAERCEGLRCQCARGLAIANRVLTVLFYGAYGVLLLLVASAHPQWLLGIAGVPAAAFVLVSVIRRRLNRPRPYDGTGVAPLISREGEGCSFPSRHAFSAFAIATCWFAESVAVAVALAACAAALGWCRVLGGVHFPRDVVAGAVAGVLTGALAVAVALSLG